MTVTIAWWFFAFLMGFAGAGVFCLGTFIWWAYQTKTGAIYEERRPRRQ